MHHSQSSGESKEPKKNENRGKLILFPEIVDYAICIIGLGG